ncbi:hypothetical protein DNTS_026772, partial [Danionella cerebrum]
ILFIIVSSGRNDTVHFPVDYWSGRSVKYATSLPTWSPLMPRPPPPRNPSSKDCHEYSSRAHTVKEPIPRRIPAGFGAAEFQCKLALQQTQAAPSVKTSGSKRRGFAEQNLGDLELQLKPSRQSAEEYLSNHHLSLEIPASTYLLILDNSGESVASCERPKVQLLTSSCPCTLGARRRNENWDTEGQTPGPPTSSTQSPPLQNSAARGGGMRTGTPRVKPRVHQLHPPRALLCKTLTEVPDEAQSLHSLGEQGMPSGDQENLFLFLLPNPSLSRDYLGAREFPGESGNKSVRSSGGQGSSSGGLESHPGFRVQQLEQNLLQTLLSLIMIVTLPGHPRPLYQEVAMMVMLRRPPVCPYVIELYDWFDRDSSMTLVMEYPQFCITLRQFMDMEISVPEAKARIAMRQLLQAVQHCFSRGIFYCDINPRNILVGVDLVPVIKLIDFSSARWLNHDGYDSSTYTGVSQYQPPEVYGRLRYHAVHTTVWLMGLTFYVMLKEQLPFRYVKDVFMGKIPGLSAISIAGCDLMKKCLKAKPEDRPTLQEISEFPWRNA